MATKGYEQNRLGLARKAKQMEKKKAETFSIPNSMLGNNESILHYEKLVQRYSHIYMIFAVNGN